MALSKSSALLQERCPRCRRGHVFRFPLSQLSRFATMNETCEVCGLRYEKEPGTFYGAMYVSYGFSVALVITLFVATFVIGNDPPLWAYFVVIIPSLILSTPFFFRYSRMIWLYVFLDFRYNPAYDEHQSEPKQ